MNIDLLVEKFITYPKIMTNSSGKLAKKYSCDKEIIIEAKEKAREHICARKVAELNNVIANQEEFIATLIEENIIPNKEKTMKFESNKPLSPKEIEQLAQVDGITTRIGMVWNKQLGSGKWVYSIQVKYIIENFYNKEELELKIEEIFSNANVKKHQCCKNSHSENPVPPYNSKKMVIYISDDHLGMLVNENSIYRNEYDGDIYKERLLKIVEYVKKQEYFEDIIVVSLGDQMNGWSQETTRKGHIVPSTSNKDQFDSYTKARKEFYDKLFSSGKAANYHVYEVNNSNHSGLGFSYMANQFLKLYVNLTYPNVQFNSTEDFIQAIPMYNHVLVITHGKDDRDQKVGFPLNLDAKTEIFFTEYLLEKGYNPKDYYCHVIKGDLHRFSEIEGKLFRYVNVGSIAPPSIWQEKNFGNSDAGALIEIFDISKDPLRKILRF